MIKTVTEGRIGYTFNSPTNYIAGRTMHEAVDVITNTEAACRHWVPGKVIHTVDGYGYWPNSGFGNQIWIEHETGIISRTCHCKTGTVGLAGDEVEPDEVYAYTGRTGYRFPIWVVHTHYEEYSDLDIALLQRSGQIRGTRIDPFSSANQVYEPKIIKQNTMRLYDKQRLVYVPKTGGKEFEYYVITKHQNHPLERTHRVKKNHLKFALSIFKDQPDGLQMMNRKSFDGLTQGKKWSPLYYIVKKPQIFKLDTK